MLHGLIPEHSTFIINNQCDISEMDVHSFRFKYIMPILHKISYFNFFYPIFSEHFIYVHIFVIYINTHLYEFNYYCTLNIALIWILGEWAERMHPYVDIDFFNNHNIFISISQPILLIFLYPSSIMVK